jgi:imidazolonepropionase-like amidohydrolase
MTGPRVIASGGGITTTGGHLWFNGIEADSEAEVRRAVRSQVKAGADFIKIFATGGGSTPGTNSLAAQYSEAEMCAITEEARRLDKRTAAHVHGTPGVYTSIAARVTTIEHCSFLTPRGIEYEPEQAQRIADAGIFVCPTVFRGKSKFFPSDPAQLPAEDKQFLAERDLRFAMLRQMAAQGVRMVSGTDAGVTCNTFTDYPGDLVLMVEGVDFTPAYVLKSATSVAAEALGRSDLGVVARGKAADLLAVQGNPLQNIRALEHPRLVVARGRLVLERF